ncbi:hypothetical protein O0L34_g17650 [Tuta absoluta]|nr:hypothetical protein O0L34_g17650 [Tuta absoluta]
MTSCGGCSKQILDLNYMECAKCNQLYDLACLNISKEKFNDLSEGSKAEWICPTCANSRELRAPRGDNSGTPVRKLDETLKLNDTFTKNINTNRGTRPAATKPNNESTGGGIENISTVDDKLSFLIKEIQLLRQEVRDLKDFSEETSTQLTTLQISVNSSAKNYAEKYEKVNRDLTELQSVVSHILYESDSRKQESLCNELEIMGIPESDNENLCHIVM